MRAFAIVALTLVVVGCARQPIEIDQAWVRATPPGATVSAAYARVVAREADEVTGVASPLAERVEMHASEEADGTMRMRPVASIALPARQAVKFEPGGLHLMLIGLSRPLLADETVPLTFSFRSADPITIDVKVLGPDAAPAH